MNYELIEPEMFIDSPTHTLRSRALRRRFVLPVSCPLDPPLCAAVGAVRCRLEPRPVRGVTPLSAWPGRGVRDWAGCVSCWARVLRAGDAWVETAAAPCAAAPWASARETREALELRHPAA